MRFTPGIIYPHTFTRESVATGVGAGVAAASAELFTKLLLHCDGTNGSTIVTDSSPVARGNATIGGAAALSTTNKKFGTAGLNLGAVGNYASFPVSADFGFGTGDFCLDLWAVRPDPEGAYVAMWCGDEDTGWGLFFGGWAGNGYDFIELDNNSGTPASPIWASAHTTLYALRGLHHYEVSRTGGTIRFFIDGVLNTIDAQGSTSIHTSDFLTPVTLPMTIGGTTMAGPTYVDEVRILKGIGGHTANFTPSTIPYVP